MILVHLNYEKELKMNNKVAVVGAGITGITTAYFLARAGHEVVIYDKRKHPAMATSYGNGGQLSASNAETWNSWRSVRKGVKWLFKADAPLKINTAFNLEKYNLKHNINIFII